jgi:hypothetical protein
LVLIIGNPNRPNVRLTVQKASENLEGNATDGRFTAKRH